MNRVDKETERFNTQVYITNAMFIFLIGLGFGLAIENMRIRVQIKEYYESRHIQKSP
jgi:hypothetical protein